MKFQPSYICSKQEGKQQQKRVNTREKAKFQLKLVKWSKKNANSRSHLRKIYNKML